MESLSDRKILWKSAVFRRGTLYHIAAKLREAFSQLFESLPRPQGVLEEQARFRFVLNRESRQALRNSIRWLQRAEDLLIGNLSRWTKNRLEESREVLLQF